MEAKRKRLFVRFTRLLLAGAGAYLLMSLGLTTVVDPWRVNALPWQSQSLDADREISDVVRIGKAALASQGRWNTAILGSSRMEIGFDPLDPAFREKPTVNLAMSAASLLENIPAGRFALAHNPGLETLILGVDPGDLTNDIDIRAQTGFYDSPLAGEQSWEQRCNQLIGSRALLDSVRTLARHFRNVSPERTELGLWTRPNTPDDLRSCVEASFWPTAKLIPDQWALRPQKVFEPKAKLLSEFIAEVRARGISLSIILPPQHAIKSVHPSSNQPEHMAWEFDLMALTELCRQANELPAKGPKMRLFSYLTFNRINTEPLPAAGSGAQILPSWIDFGHARKSVGGLILAEIFPREGGPAKPLLGVDLLAADWNEFRSAWLKQHAEFCQAQAADVAWWRSLAAKSAGPARGSDSGDNPPP